MFQPEDPLAPPQPAFDEPWQAQALALADSMVKAGHFTAHEWGETLGAALRNAAATGAPDTLETYYTCVITALETLSTTRAGLDHADLTNRRTAWETAYRRTPHGMPVEL